METSKPFYLKPLSKVYVVIISLILVTLIGILDYLTGTEISFSIFYLIPITFIAFKAGKYEGLMLSFLSTVVWLMCDINGIKNYSNSAIPYWNALVRFMFFIFIVYLIDSVRKLNLTLEEKVSLRTIDLENEINKHRSTLKEVERKNRKLSTLAKRIQGIKEVENKKIAREIHDELGQTMTAMKMDIYGIMKKHPENTDIVEKLACLSDDVDNAMISIRELSKKLRPRFLDELGLVAAIDFQLNEFQARTGVITNFEYCPEELSLRNSCSDALFRIFQEALTNVARHAKASSVEVSIKCNGDKKVIMKILDDGIGITEDCIEKENSIGILGMRERAQLVGGCVNISRNNGSGTKVEVIIPIKEKIRAEE